MTHDHSEFHNEKMVSNLIQAEDHLQAQHCPECEDKHLRSASAYMEEEVSHNPSADPRLLMLAQKVRNVRRELQSMQGMKHDNSQDTLTEFS